jgi:hypothetical protein
MPLFRFPENQGWIAPLHKKYSWDEWPVFIEALPDAYSLNKPGLQ